MPNIVHVVLATRPQTNLAIKSDKKTTKTAAIVEPVVAADAEPSS